MNSKLIGYDEAVERLKRLATIQRITKKSSRKSRLPPLYREGYQRSIIKRKSDINLLLSIIDAHKKARKLYEEARYYKELHGKK